MTSAPPRFFPALPHAPPCTAPAASRCGVALVGGAPGAPLATLSRAAGPGTAPPPPVTGSPAAPGTPGPLARAGAAEYGGPGARLVAAALAGVGLAMIFFDDEHQGMHDAMVDSWLVHD